MMDSTEPNQGYTAERTDLVRFPIALAAAVDYRGDVTLSITDGSTIEGYVFDLHGDMDTGTIGYMTRDDTSPRQLDTNNILRIDFSGRDMAEGKSFDTWIEKYVKKKLAGEHASIDCESLED
ncbi:MAG: hypothetical protein VX527_09900 [Planctomycetota bacterium]|nr:hypothetical protein [Planctomycetota bacterium]